MGIDKLAREELAKFKMSDVEPYLKHVSVGSRSDICNVAQSLYYRYLYAMVKAIKPKQVIELGSAGGASLLMMLAALPKDSHLYAMSVPEPEGEFRFVKEDYPNLTTITGDDLVLKNWFKHEINLVKTDLWFFDTDHTYDQLHAELELYDCYFKPGAVVLIDDIRLNEGMTRAWDEIEYNKLSLPDLHHSGFGLFVT